MFEAVAVLIILVWVHALCKDLGRLVERVRADVLGELKEVRQELLRELEPLSGVTSCVVREMADKLDRLSPTD